MKEAHDRAYEILSSHREQMDLMASVLLERETVEGEACQALLDNNWNDYLQREGEIIAAKEAEEAAARARDEQLADPNWNGQQGGQVPPAQPGSPVQPAGVQQPQAPVERRSSRRSPPRVVSSPRTRRQSKPAWRCAAPSRWAAAGSFAHDVLGFSAWCGWRDVKTSRYSKKAGRQARLLLKERHSA